MEEDHSGDPCIPGRMCKGSVLLQKGHFIAIGYREAERTVMISSFDGQ